MWPQLPRGISRPGSPIRATSMNSGMQELRSGQRENRPQEDCFGRPLTEVCVAFPRCRRFKTVTTSTSWKGLLRRREPACSAQAMKRVIKRRKAVNSNAGHARMAARLGSEGNYDAVMGQRENAFGAYGWGRIRLHHGPCLPDQTGSLTNM